MNQPISELIKNLSGDIVWNLIIVIATTMPVWIVLNELKEKWKLFKKYRVLVNGTLLALDSYYIINNNYKGILKEITIKGITLEDGDKIHHIPISIIQTITKIKNNYEKSINKSKKEK